MKGERQPTCWTIAGPNGAGKTTFALEYLPRTAGCQVFVNADLIAAGLAPLAPEGRTVAASRVFLHEISQNILAKRDFGFETKLSGLAYRQLIKRMKSEGWRVELVYLALPSVKMAKHRVAERVFHGGHSIPLAGIERRFFRSLDNFFSEYVFLADQAVCYCNADRDPVVVFAQCGKSREVAEPVLLPMLETKRRHAPG